MPEAERQRAIQATATYPDGQPRYLCAECGARLILRENGLGCGRDVFHAGMAPAPHPSEATILVRLQRGGGGIDELTTSQTRRISYFILRYHAWGQHGLCRWLSALGIRPAGCDPPAPERSESSLW
jgi:hypothetical protein